MSTIIEEMTEEKKEIQLIKQLSLFEEVTEDDIRKTMWLLHLHPEMLDIIKNYELTMTDKTEGLTEYELATAYGTVGRRETGQELTSDTTANSAILKAKREATYRFYKRFAEIIGGVLKNIRDPHESMIAKLLFVDGMRVKRAIGHMTRIKPTIDIYPIAETTFYEKRRKAISNVTNSLKINGTLDHVMIDKSPGRNAEGECRFVFPEWQ